MVTIKSKVYNKFKGVDFSSDASLVADFRSPDAENIISDSAGMPEKRPGWRTVAADATGRAVNGLHDAVIDGETHYIAHIGAGIYRFYPEAAAPEERLVLLYEGEGEGKSESVNFGNRLWLLTGAEYLVYDGEEVKPVSEIAYVPTTLIATYPAGGGTFFEAINLLTPQRKNEFIADGESKTYQLDSVDLDSVDKVTVDGVELAEGAGYTADLALGQVLFTAAPPEPLVGQEATVFVTFSRETEGYAGRINQCGIISTYGVGNRDRVVISGNGDYRNQDWISGYNDASYMPDTGYAAIGSEATAIMGYAPIGAYQAIIKQDNGQDATVYLRSGELREDGEAYFPVRQGVSGVGAIARGVIGLINDEPVFLSPQGVFGLTSNIITAERMVQNRSYYIDARLLKEPGLSQAVSCRWQGYFLICVNGAAYILDGRQQKTYWQRSGGEYAYECYYWSNIPARCFMVHRGAEVDALWFGTGDGRICRLSTDIEGLDKYNDDGAAIVARWSTPADDDGDPTLQKTMIKQGCAVTIKPYTRSSAVIYFRTDADSVEREARRGEMDIFDFRDIDFSRFTFNTNDTPQEIFLRRKVKKYKRLKIVAVNDGVNEGFGVYAITKHYVTGGYAKK